MARLGDYGLTVVNATNHPQSFSVTGHGRYILRDIFVPAGTAFYISEMTGLGDWKDFEITITDHVDPTDAVAAHLEKRLTNLPPDSGIGFVMDAHGPAELRKIAAELIQLITTGRIDG